MKKKKLFEAAASISLLISNHLFLVHLISLYLSELYDLLTSPDCLPDLLQGGLAEKGVNEAFILTTFKLQPKTGTTVFGLFNPRDNSKYFEFTVMGKLNRGKKTWKRSCFFSKAAPLNVLYRIWNLWFFWISSFQSFYILILIHLEWKWLVTQLNRGKCKKKVAMLYCYIFHSFIFHYYLCYLFWFMKGFLRTLISFY